MSLRSRSNWNLEMLVFKEKGKPEYPEKNLSKQGREPTTNSTHIWRRRQDLNQGHIGGRRVLSALCHPCSLKSCWYSTGWKVVLKDPFKKAWGAKAPSPTSLNRFPTKDRKTIKRLPVALRKKWDSTYGSFLSLIKLFSAFLFSFSFPPCENSSYHRLQK